MGVLSSTLSAAKIFKGPSARSAYSALSRVFETLRNADTSLPKLAGYLLAVLFALIVYRSLTDKTIVIEPFEVSGRLAEQGYSGRVVANRLLSAVMDFRSELTARPGLLSEFNSTFRAVEPEIEVEAAGYSSKKVSQWIAYAAGQRFPVLRGEVTSAGDKLHITIRAAGVTCTRTGNSNELDTLLKDIAPQVIRAVEPYFYALHVADTDPKTSLVVLSDLLRSGDQRWHAWAYNLWGIILDKQARHEEARERFEKVLASREPFFGDRSLRSAHAAAHNNIAVSLAKAGTQNHNEIVRHLDEAIALKPDYASAYGNLAAILADRGQHEEALRHFAKAIDLAPGRADLYHKRGLVYRTQRDWARAAADLSFSRVLGNTSAAVLYDLGLAYKEQGNCAGAGKLFDEYLLAEAAGPYSDRARAYKHECSPPPGDTRRGS